MAVPLQAAENANSDLLDAEAVEKRVRSEVVCAKRILEVQQQMFAHPSSSARNKFRRMVELFDMWEWSDLQEHLAVPVVRLPEVNNGANVVGGPQGPINQWWGCEFVHCSMIGMDVGCLAWVLLELVIACAHMMLVTFITARA